ncbi:hypothetical protein HYV43_04590 [Candidatus Micrarchaeota archaeon]|nr:hypothetical protein [Candidatus Micrarchaeota archaeon]
MEERRVARKVYWMNPHADGPELAQALERMLERMNTPVSVTHFESPETLNHELSRQRPHLVLANIGVDYGGLNNLLTRLKTGETFDAIKEDEDRRKPGPKALASAREWDVPVYVVSGHTDLIKRREKTEAELRERGAAGVFAIPNEFTQMVHAVKRHLDQVR